LSGALSLLCFSGRPWWRGEELLGVGVLVLLLGVLVLFDGFALAGRGGEGRCRLEVVRSGSWVAWTARSWSSVRWWFLLGWAAELGRKVAAASSVPALLVFVEARAGEEVALLCSFIAS